MKNETFTDPLSHLTGPLAIVGQLGELRAMLGAEIGHDEINAAPPPVIFHPRGIRHRFLRVSNLIACSFNYDLGTVALHKFKRGGDIFLQRERRGIEHDRGKATHVPFKKGLILVVQGVVEVEHDAQVRVRRRLLEKCGGLGEKQTKPHVPSAAVGVLNGLAAGRIIVRYRQYNWKLRLTYGFPPLDTGRQDRLHGGQILHAESW